MGGLMDLFRKGMVSAMDKAEINEGYSKWKSEEGSALVDVREPDEYAAGHLPGSVNIPLSTIAAGRCGLPKDTRIYAYCYSGMRSRKACRFLDQQGYETIDLGAVTRFRRQLEK